MAFIRSIKQDFFSSGSITRLSPWARLFYIATWLEADREGRFKWDPMTLANRYFPAEIDGQADIEALGRELAEDGLIEFYESGGKKYAHIPTFTDHQVINNRERDSVLPAPQKDRKGKERKGKERKERKSGVGTPLSRVETLPEWLPKEKWEDFLQFRIDKKAPMTEKAEHLAILRLEKFQAKGHDPLEIIADAIISNWSGLFEPKGGPSKTENGPALTMEELVQASYERRHGKQE